MEKVSRGKDKMGNEISGKAVRGIRNQKSINGVPELMKIGTLHQFGTKIEIKCHFEENLNYI